jgi:hypothetical protein
MCRSVVNSASMVTRLRSILCQVNDLAGTNFSGVGLLISDRPDDLPIVSLRPLNLLPSEMNTVRCLATISSQHSEYHDGFHILSSDWRLVRVAQYFSPPIIANAKIDRTKTFGGRYLAALFGSAIKHVQLTGIATRSFGVAVFKHGIEQSFEPAI